jgi:hypothetical protein
MKNTLLYIASTCLLAAGFSACDSGSGTQPVGIVGTWLQTRNAGWIKGQNGETIMEWDEAFESTMVFNSDGSGSYSDAENNALTTWRMTGNTITIDMGDGDTEFLIERLDAGALVVSQSGQYLYDLEDEHYGETVTLYRRMTCERQSGGNNGGGGGSVIGR